jgi:hypothetical protein
MGLFSGPLTIVNVDSCYNIVYGTSRTSSIIGSPIHAGPGQHLVPHQNPAILDHLLIAVPPGTP